MIPGSSDTSLPEKVAGFAEKEVAHRAESINSWGGFPMDLWCRMGEEGLLALNLPRSHGGLGCDSSGTMEAVETFVRHGQSIGLAFSWMIHLIVSRYFFMKFGSEEQRAKYLPGLAKGTMTASIAISEPGAGAHPKLLKTSADTDKDGCFILNGEKSFLSNGPIADLFIIFAVSSTQSGRKGFSALLVERNTPGLSLTPELDIGCLYPSPHGGLKLESCRIPASSVLGEKHSAYEQMAKPFRVLEDTFLAGLALGGMELQLDRLLCLMRTKDRHYSDEVKSGLGELRTLLDGLRVVVHGIARLEQDAGIGSPELLSVVLSFRHLSIHYQSLFEKLLSKLEKVKSTSLNNITRDLTRIAGIAGNIVSIQQRKLGESLLLRKGTGC